MCAPEAVVVSGWSGTKEVNPDRRGLKPVLGWLVYLAMSYGTMKLRVGVNRESGESWMKFFGPRWYRHPTWWDIVPPEPYCYPVMLQICLSLAELQENLPIRGVIPAIRQGKHLRLELSVDEIDSFQIAWDQVFAWDRQSAGTSYPEEEHVDDGKGNGVDAQPA